MGQIYDIVQNAEGKVYMYLADSAVCRQFLQDAENEGFRFSDGVMPTARGTSNLYSLHKDKSLCYLGYVGHLEYQCTEDPKKLLKVDYRDVLGIEKKERQGPMSFQDQLQAASRTKEEAAREEAANRSLEIEARAKVLVSRIRDALMACARNGEGRQEGGRMTITTEVLLPFNEFIVLTRRYESISVFTKRKRVYTTYALREGCQEAIDRAKVLAAADGIEVLQMHLIHKHTGEEQKTLPYTTTVYAAMSPGATWNLYLTCRTSYKIND